jgi:hypothetical protein
MKIDALTTEWPDSVWSEKEGIKFAIMNDDQNVYFVLSVAKQDLRRQIMMRGMTIWFDPLAREKKTIGIRYPIGVAEGGVRRPTDRDIRGGFAPPLSEFEFISPLERIPLRVSTLAGQGVELRINNTQESLVYELKVPLSPSADHPYSIESHTGAQMSVGIEISGFERSGAPGGADAGAGRGRRGPPGADPRQGAITSMEGISVWATIRLATNP